MDYSHLEGKEVQTNIDNKKIKGLVVGVDEDMGITVVNAKDKEDYLLCLNFLKGSPKDRKVFDEIFNIIVKQIESGEISFTTMREEIFALEGIMPGGSPSQDGCVFV